MTKEEYGRDENAAPAKDTTPSRVGDIVFSPLGTPREGTLVCDGSAVSRQTYKELFDFLGVSCGEGDGETTFNLPDLRDQWILCAGTEHEAGESVAEGLPDISGWFYNINVANSHGVVYNPSGVFSQEARVSPGTAGAASTAGGNIYVTYFNADQSSPIYGASTHVTPASVAVLPCIVYE